MQEELRLSPCVDEINIKFAVFSFDPPKFLMYHIFQGDLNNLFHAAFSQHVLDLPTVDRLWFNANPRIYRHKDTIRYPVY